RPPPAWRGATSVPAATAVKPARPPPLASPGPSAFGLRSTATTRSPSSRARRIARRWCRPAPTKSTVPSISADDANGSGLAARLAAVALSGKRILLTGGAGFIGSALARRLVEAHGVGVVDILVRGAHT